MIWNPGHLLFLSMCVTLLVICSHPTDAKYTSMCSKCICVGTMIHCSREHKVTMIPDSLKKKYSILNIQQSKFSSDVIYRINMTSLGHLVELKINYCNLRRIERLAFVKMKKLKILDLSYNYIHIIQPFAFSGLNLNQLYIENNYGLRIYDHSFRGMNCSELSLRSCGIDELPYRSVENLHLSHLLLFNNSIKELDWKFEKIFSSPGKLIDLTANPLHCNCQIAWLLKLNKKWHVMASDNLRSVNMTCGSPAVLTGRELSKMKQEHLPCTQPFIEGVVLDIQSTGSVQLICKSFGYPAPGLFWSYLGEDGDRRELKRSPVRIDTYNRFLSSQDYLYPPPVKYKETSLTLNVNMTPSTRRNYTCTTWNEINDKQTILVSIKGAPAVPNGYRKRFPMKKIYNKNNELEFDLSNNNNNQLNDVVKQNTKLQANSNNNYPDKSRDNLPPKSFREYIFQKQFTLIEMIGAVVGTFAVTLASLLIISRCIVLSRMKRSKNQKTYWTVNGSVAYSATGSHEYDVPRIDHVTYQPAKLDEIEFLDFKTQRKLYTGT